MIITISGLPGSGKTTVARMVAERIGFRHYSAGNMRGEMAIKTRMWTE
jgi:cytidylate kinase